MRILILGVLVVGLIAFVGTHDSVAAKGGNEKVDVCHYDASIVLWDLDVELGHVISISANAVDAHVAHGDAAGGWWPIEEQVHPKIGKVNCAYFPAD